MQSQAVDWLPPGCIESPAAARPFAQAITQWAEHWFAANPWAVQGGWRCSDDGAGDNWAVLRATPELTLAGADKAALHLARAVLGLPELPRYSEADLRVLRRLATRVLDDLEQRVTALLGPPGGGALGLDTQYALQIGPDDTPKIALRCHGSQLIPIARRTFPVLLSKGELTDRTSACDNQELPISALLGSASLTIEQIAQFEIGDVIVLDQPSDQPVPLAIADSPSAVLCTLGERSGKIILEVMETA